MHLNNLPRKIYSIKDCLDKRFEVPASLVVEVLENEIKAIGGRSWRIVSGFPNDTEQLAEFEKRVVYPKVSKTSQHGR